MSEPKRQQNGSTQEGQPSEVEAMEARQGLAMQWWLVALVPIAIAAAIVIAKLI